MSNTFIILIIILIPLLGLLFGLMFGLFERKQALTSRELEALASADYEKYRNYILTAYKKGRVK